MAFSAFGVIKWHIRNEMTASNCSAAPSVASKGSLRILGHGGGGFLMQLGWPHARGGLNTHKCACNQWRRPRPLSPAQPDRDPHPPPWALDEPWRWSRTHICTGTYRSFCLRQAPPKRGGRWRTKTSITQSCSLSISNYYPLPY